MKKLRWLGVSELTIGALAIADGCASFGSRPKGQRLARMKRSPEWHDGSFVNPQPIADAFAVITLGFSVVVALVPFLKQVAAMQAPSVEAP